MAAPFLEDTELKNFLAKSEDERQGYTAFCLYQRLCQQYELQNVLWKQDSFLKHIILETNIGADRKVYVPLHFTFRPTAKWIRDASLYLKGLNPLACLYLAFSTSSQTFVMYKTSHELLSPKYQGPEAMQKSKNSECILVHPQI